MTVVNIASGSNYVDEGSDASFTVTLSEPHSSDVVVFYRTEAGSATASVDYQAVGEPSYEAPGSVVISAGSTSATILVPTAEDSIDEDDETFSLTISEAVDSSSVSLSIGTSASGVTIADDDSPGSEISLSISDASIVEGSVASFTISLSQAATQDVSIWYQTGNGTASGNDFTSASSVAVISAGSTSVSIAIQTTEDSIDESDETFSLSITQALYADSTSVAIGDGVGTGTILDDDSPSTEISVSVGDVVVGEGDQASFTISLTSVSSDDVSVWFGTHHGAAMGSDYTSSSGYAVVSAGTLTATVAIPTTDDSVDEADETFSLSLTQASSGGSNVPIAVSTGVATILDNDEPDEVTVSVDDASASEGSPLQFIVRLSAPATQDVWVWYSTVSGTATTADYHSASGIAVISAGQTSMAVEVATSDDSVDEPNEVFSLTITQVAYPNNVALGISDASGRGTIVDNDESPENDPPVAIADSYELDEDETLVISAPGLLANDVDPNGTLLTAVLVSGVSHGTLTIGANGSFSYVPDANYHGVDTFTYRANDGQSLSSLTTVTLTILASDDAPIAAGDVYWLEEDGSLSVPTPGLLSNDIDVEGDILAVSEATQPAHGSITWNADGEFTYTPDSNFFGFDSFTYRATDGANLSPVMTVTLYVSGVNDVPAGQPDAFELNEDTGLYVTAPGLLLNDHDCDGRPLAASVVDEPVHGVLTLQADGSFNYVPDHDFIGSDTFTYRISNGFLESPPITVSLTVHEYRQEIRIEESGVTLIDGLASVDFGSTLPGSPLNRVFNVRNVGTAPLIDLCAAK